MSVTLRLLIALCMLIGLLPASAGAIESAPYFATDAPNGAVLGPLANQPQAVRVGSKTYVAYQGPGLDPYVACYDDATGRWDGPYRAGTNPHTWDTHGAPALLVDARGNVHVFFGSHHQPMLHVRTASPDRLDAWIQLPSIPGATTYAKPMRTSSGPLLFYRNRNGEAPADFDWWYSTSADDGDTWTQSFEFMDLKWPYSAYPCFTEVDDGSLLVAWVEVDWAEYFADQTWGRHHVFFARRDAEGEWRNSQDETITIPVTRESAFAECLVTDSGDEFTNSPMACLDAEGEPVILFTQGTEGPEGGYSYLLARATEDTWTVSDTAPTDSFFDSSALRLEGNRLVAYVEQGGAGPDGTESNNASGGRMRRLFSGDGRAWTDDGPIDPGPPGTLLGDGVFHGTQVVSGADAGSRILFQEWGGSAQPEAQGVYLWSETDGLRSSITTAAVTRIGERDRYYQAASIARQAYPAGTDTVVIASGERFADAMVAAPLASTKSAPILLTQQSYLPGATREAVKYLRAKNAIIVGGPASVDPSVEPVLKQSGITSVRRISGTDRYDTAARVATEVAGTKSPKHAFVASGEVFADGLAIGSVAAQRKEPILLVAQSYVPTRTAEALAALGPANTVVVGGDIRIPAATYDALGGTQRIGGRSRYDVAVGIADWGRERGATLPFRTVVVTGEDFPDCLTASIVSARLKAATLLTPHSSIVTATADHLSRGATGTIDVYVYGGPNSVTETVVDRIRALVGAQ